MTCVNFILFALAFDVLHKWFMKANSHTLGCADMNQGSQSNEALQQQVVQQQADITRLESELAALQSQFGVTHQQ